MKSLSGIRICHVTSAHPADDDRIFFKEARSLAAFGADVVILHASDRSAPADSDRVRFCTFSGGAGIGGRLLAMRRIEDAVRSLECDVVHCHEPDSLVAALRTKREHGAKVIFDSHEMWGGVVAGRFPRRLWGLAETTFKLFEHRYLVRCDAAIGASNAISSYLAAALGRRPVATILNVPVTGVFGLDAPGKYEDRITFCHDGHLTFDRGLKVVAEATRIVSLRYPIRLRIVGDVFGREREWLDSFVARHGLQAVVERTGWLAYRQVGMAIAPCHVGLVCLQPSPNNAVAAPNKCFNYLLYGLPVLGPRFSRSHFAILEKEGCAVLSDPTDVKAFAEAMLAMASNRERTARLGEQARFVSSSKYRWEHMEPVLLDLYLRVLANGERRP